MNTSTRIHHGFQPVEGARIGTIERDPAVSMWHYSYTNLGGLTEKMNKYTTIEAEQALGDGKGDPSMLDFVGRSPASAGAVRPARRLPRRYRRLCVTR